ncbi:MAG TPA: CBS domain-containing protein [Bryobacteraceae bacterium]|jgi:CBS domain-containing protein/sporulation protein YlmC with PRC-barrel domain|nr:CBS domain-containing protein [Bryobacteraceae bacterium]
MAENFFYFTDLLGLPVYDLKHRRIGRVRDAAIVPLIHPARIDRYLVGAGSSWLSIRYDQIATISLNGIQLSNEKLYPYHSDEYMLRLQRDLLDQQIIDVNGRKVVRVTDVSLEVRHDERDSLMILEVDVGIRSILRRLLQGVVPPRWVRRLQRPISPNSIRWEFCNIVEADPLRRLRLNISNEKLERLHPADLADIVEELGPAEREAIFETMDSEVAAEALSEIDPKMQASILEALEPEVAADIVEEMSPDEAAHALAELKEETTAEILDEMETEPLSEVKELLEYEEGTAGGLMNTEAIVLPEDTALATAMVSLREHEDLLENTHVLFLANPTGQITAAVPLARLFLADGATSLRELATDPLISTRADEKQERIMELFDKYNLLALPVVDDDGSLAGVITADDVISVLRQR